MTEPSTGDAPTLSSPPEPTQDITQTARDVGAAAKDRLRDVRDEALSKLESAKSTAAEKAEGVRSQALEEVEKTAAGLEAAAGEMEGSPVQQEILREAASGLKQLLHALEGKSVGAIVGDLSEFGRSNPLAYLGGAAFAGFALARFARASSEASSQDEPSRSRSDDLPSGPTMTPSGGAEGSAASSFGGSRDA